MKIAYLILVVLHGLIHLMGVVKGFGLKEIKELTLPISTSMAMLWLSTSLVLLTYVAMLAVDHRYAWAVGFFGALLSQVLVFMFWTDAKFGTVPNLVIIVVSLFQFGQFQFNRMVQSELESLKGRVLTQQLPVISKQDVEALPTPVSNWLMRTGIVGQPMIARATLKQQAEMKMQPDQKDWMEATAHQYSDLVHPAFHWTVDAQMNGLLGFSGRDRFINGEGEMLIKLNGLIPIVDEHGSKLTEGSAQRFLGELVWFPSFALSPYIHWTPVDESSAQATLNYKDVQVSGTFRFNESGDFSQFSTMRYKGNSEEDVRYEWVLDVLEHSEFNGVRIPSYMTATWKLPEGDWVWLRLRITELTFENGQ